MDVNPSLETIKEIRKLLEDGKVIIEQENYEQMKKLLAFFSINFYAFDLSVKKVLIELKLPE